MPWICSGSAIASPTGSRGSKEANGSWKTTWIWRRILRISPESSSVSSVPSNRTEPDVGLISCRTARPVVVFPHPDSPTRPSVSPGAMEKDTPDTAWTSPTLRRKSPPPRTGKCLNRSVTSSSAGCAGGVSTEGTVMRSRCR